MSSTPKRPLKVIVPVLLLALVVAAFIGCNRKDGDGDRFGGNGGPRDVVTIFFSKYQGNTSIVENVVRKLPSDAQRDSLKFALVELLKGPSQDERGQGFYSEIPQGTKLLSVNTKGDTVTINLSSQFTTGGGANSMEQRFEELKQTVLSNDSRHSIELAVEGQTLEVLGGEGLEVQESLQREAQ